MFESKKLKTLFVNCYKGKDLFPFGRLINLETLKILTAPVKNLEGLATLSKLRYLRLGNLQRLTSLAGVEKLTNLEHLQIQTCRAIGSIEEVGFLSQLQKLDICDGGKIQSLKPLDKLNRLESVVFFGSTNILDGDLSPLVRQKNLSSTSFQNRRHYSHWREEFGKAYTG